MLRLKTKKRKFKTWRILIIAIIALVFYAAFIEPRWVEVTHYNVTLPGLPRSLNGIKVVQLSDLHRYCKSSDAIVRKAVRLANNEHPDIVVVTGDLVNTLGANSKPCVQDLSYLKTRLGTYAVLGNHDHWHGVNDVKNALEEGKIRLLNNANKRVAPGLYVIGIDDKWTGRPDVAQAYTGVDESAGQIALSHTPLAVNLFEGKHCLLLTGHTHGGQVCLPFIPRNRLPGLIGFPYISGWYRVGSVQMYVNRGIGMIFPRVRFLCRPEVSVFTLYSKKDVKK